MPRALTLIARLLFALAGCAFLSACGQTAAPPNEAETLYRDFEKTIATTPAFSLSFRSDVDRQDLGTNFGFRGTLLVSGERFRTVLQDDEGKETAIVIASDGELVRAKSHVVAEAPIKDWLARKDWRTIFSQQFAQMGAATCFSGKGAFKDKPEPMPPFTYSDFKMLPSEADAIQIEFRVTPSDLSTQNEFVGTYRLTFDRKTRLPIRRTMESKTGGKTDGVVTEIYSDWNLNPPVEDKQFASPK